MMDPMVGEEVHEVAGTSGDRDVADESWQWTLKLPVTMQSYLEQYYEAEHLQRILRSIARPPSRTTIRANTLKTTPEKLLPLLQAHLRSAQQSDEC